MNATLAVPPATPASRHVPLSISISSPQDPIPADGQAVFRGPVKGLHPGETIWLFSKQVTDRSGAPVTSGVVLINAGPCDVAKDIWRCPKTRVGGPGARDEGSYRIWVTVLSPVKCGYWRMIWSTATQFLLTTTRRCALGQADTIKRRSCVSKHGWGNLARPRFLRYVAVVRNGRIAPSVVAGALVNTATAHLPARRRRPHPRMRAPG